MMVSRVGCLIRLTIEMATHRTDKFWPVGRVSILAGVHLDGNKIGICKESFPMQKGVPVLRVS